MGKVLSTNEDLTLAELELIIRIANKMELYVAQYDFNMQVRGLMRNLTKKHFGIQLFLFCNILNYNSKIWCEPREIKNRFENHMGLNPDTNNDLLTANQPICRNGIDSRDIYRALIKLQGKMRFKNITGTERITRVTKQEFEFEGFPSTWKFPNCIEVVSSILRKPRILKMVYEVLLKSGLLYRFWTCTFLTLLGCLRQIDENDLLQSEQAFRAAIPEKIKNKPSPEAYNQQLGTLRYRAKRLNDREMLKNAGKMAGYIIKNQPEFSILGTHIEGITVNTP